ncbi:MAG: T9SS type A sorting domain-containing protein [Ignavibacteriaceae bacterium]
MNYSNSHFINDSIGFISSDTTLFRTTDSGENWEAIADTLGSFIRTYFYDESLGFLIYYEYIGAGNFTYVYKTTDLGNTWILSNECASLEYCGFGKIKIINSTNAIMSRGIVNVVPTDNLIKTTDGGNSWNSFPSPNFAFGSTDYEFLSIEHGWITTISKLIVRTTNMGSNWDTLQTPLTLDDVIKNFEFFNPNISYGISSNHIFFTNDGWVTYSIVDSIVTNVDTQQSLPTQFILYQNYPNPFNPATVISYQLSVSGNVTLIVYDLLGRETSTLIDEYKPAGRYEVEFNATGLSSGVYYYKLIYGDKIETKKMILLR